MDFEVHHDKRREILEADIERFKVERWGHERNREQSKLLAKGTDKHDLKKAYQDSIATANRSIKELEAAITVAQAELDSLPEPDVEPSE